MILLNQKTQRNFIEMMKWFHWFAWITGSTWWRHKKKIYHQVSSWFDVKRSPSLWWNKGSRATTYSIMRGNDMKLICQWWRRRWRINRCLIFRSHGSIGSWYHTKVERNHLLILRWMSTPIVNLSILCYGSPIYIIVDRPLTKFVITNWTG